MKESVFYTFAGGFLGRCNSLLSDCCGLALGLCSLPTLQLRQTPGQAIHRPGEANIRNIKMTSQQSVALPSWGRALLLLTHLSILFLKLQTS